MFHATAFSVFLFIKGMLEQTWGNALIVLTPILFSYLLDLKIIFIFFLLNNKEINSFQRTDMFSLSVLSIIL